MRLPRKHSKWRGNTSSRRNNCSNDTPNRSNRCSRDSSRPAEDLAAAHDINRVKSKQCMEPMFLFVNLKWEEENNVETSFGCYNAKSARNSNCCGLGPRV